MQTMKWAIRSQAPNLAITRVWRRFNDHTVVGRRQLVTADEGLRYDLLLGENQGREFKP